MSLLKQETTELNSDRLQALRNIEAPDEDYDSAVSEAERSDGDTQVGSKNDAPENDRVTQDMNGTISSHDDEEEEEKHDLVSSDYENNDEETCSERSPQHEGFRIRTSALAVMAELENDIARVDIWAAKVLAVRKDLLAKIQTFRDEVFASGEHAYGTMIQRKRIESLGRSSLQLFDVVDDDLELEKSFAETDRSILHLNKKCRRLVGKLKETRELVCLTVEKFQEQETLTKAANEESIYLQSSLETSRQRESVVSVRLEKAIVCNAQKNQTIDDLHEQVRLHNLSLQRLQIELAEASHKNRSHSNVEIHALRRQLETAEIELRTTREDHVLKATHHEQQKEKSLHEMEACLIQINELQQIGGYKNKAKESVSALEERVKRAIAAATGMRVAPHALG